MSEMEDGKKGCGFSQCPLHWVTEKDEKKKKKKKNQFVKAFLFVSKLCPFPLSQSTLFLALPPLVPLFQGCRENEGTEAAQV